MTIGAGGRTRRPREADDAAPNWRSDAPACALAALSSMRSRVIGGVQISELVESSPTRAVSCLIESEGIPESVLF